MKYVTGLLFSAGILTWTLSYHAGAQEKTAIGQISAIERVVEHAGGDGAFHAAKKGTSLFIGDSVRTGRRSKADLNFSDGSLLRLGQLASVQVQGTKAVRLTGGRLLFSMLKPGRVVAGTAAAEIKGSVGIITTLENGATEFSLYSGRMDVVTDKETIPVPPGSYVTVFGDSTHSPVKTAPPMQFASNQKDTTLLEAPLDVPFVGSRADEQSRQTPERLILNDTYYFSRPYQVAPFPDRSDPLVARDNASRSGTGDALLALGLAGGAALASRPEKAKRADVAHLDEADPSLGHKFNTDATVTGIGIASTDGQGPGAIAAGRFRALYSRGPVFAQLALSPYTVHREGTNFNYPGIVSDASVTLRTARGDFEFGRQRLLSGPTRATVIGSIARQGGRSIVDAVTYRPKLGQGQMVQISYLLEAYPRDLPYEVGGAQKGFYARAAILRHVGNFGVNVLRYANLPVRSATGVSLDFALPVVRNKLELYGEVGRDPYRRQLRTVGLGFPGIYDRTGFETYLEYARLSQRADALDVPSELTLQVYKRLNTKWTLSMAASHLGDSSDILTLGLTTGTHKYLSDGD